MTATERLVLASLALVGACTRSPVASIGCRSDDACEPGLACSGGGCIPRATAAQSWAVEISPLSDSTAALTEIASVALDAGTLSVAAGRKATFTVAFALEAPAAAIAKGHVVLSVPSAIPGRPDLAFETNLPETPVGGAHDVTLPIPAAIVGRSGTLQILPTTPDASTHAPARFTVTVAPALQVTLPSKMVTIRGRLLSALGDARKDFVARAFQDGVLVSNIAVTMGDGVFTLMVPMGLVAAPGGATIALDLAPPPDSVVDPWISAKPFSLAANKDLGDLKLPTFSQPNVFRFVAHGRASDGPAVSSAIVRARSVLAEDATTITDFQRDGLTDAEGRVSLPLLPGSTAALRSYELAVIPPPDSPFGIRCIAKFPLSAGGTAEMPANVPPVVLPVRPTVSGKVTDFDGAPATGVVIVATRLASDVSLPCAESAGTLPTTTTTGAGGGYDLSLDPGTYRLDFDPPAGAPFPRLTETGVVVPAPPAAGDGGTISHPVRLPRGVLVEGSTRDADDKPLPLAGVRLYEVTCTSPATCTGPQRVAPLLKAEARSDASGHFRVVVATPR